MKKLFNIITIIGMLLFNVLLVGCSTTINFSQKETILTGTVITQSELGQQLIINNSDNSVIAYGLYVQSGQKIKDDIDELNNKYIKDHKQLYMIPFKTIDGEIIIIHCFDSIDNPKDLEPNSIHTIKINKDFGKVYYLLDHAITYRGFETTYGRKDFQLILPSYLVEFVE